MPATPATSSATGRTTLVTWIAVIVAVGFGSSTAYFASQARAARRAAAAGAPRAGGDAVAGQAAADSADAGRGSDEVRRLRAENAALRRRLLEQEMGLAGAGRPGPDGGALRSWMDRLEEMRKNDPERYKRMMERREQRRAEVEASLQEQLARLDQRLEALGAADTADAKKESELLSKIASVMAELSQLNDKVQALGQLPEAERAAQGQALGQQARELYGQLADLRAEDRRNQLVQLGAQLGLGSDQSTQLAASVDRIVKETDTRGQRPRGPGGPMGGGRRP